MKIDRITNVITIKNDKLNAYHDNSIASRGNDNLAVSDLGRLSQQIEAAVKKSPEVRIERIEFLQQAIESGSYKVDAREIARKMLEQ